MSQRLIDNKTLDIVSVETFKVTHKNTLFPRILSDAVVQPFGYSVIRETKKPAHNELTHGVEFGEIEQVDGIWKQNWNIVERPDAADRVRAERDRLLLECDWVVIKNTEKGTNIPLEWEVYRQALRDIPDQEGFPYDIEWPTKP